MAKRVINNGDGGLVSRNAINGNFTEIFDEIEFSRGIIVDGTTKSQQNTHAPIFTISFDDTRLSAYEGWFPFLEGLGIQGSMIVNPPRLGNPLEDPPNMEWAQLTEMYNAGWEIVSHSMSHEDMRDYTEAELIYEFEESKRVLESHGYEVINFAWPRTAYTNELERRVCRRYYRSARGYGDPAYDDELVNEDAFNPFNLRSFPDRIEIETPAGLQELKDNIDIAYDENRWLIYTGHNWTQDREDAMLEIIQYIQAKENDMDFVTINQGLDLKYNYFESGDKFSVGENGVRIDEADGKALVATENRTALGIEAGEGNREDYGTYLGYWAGKYSEGIRNTHVGPEAGVQAILNASVSLGFKAGRNALSGWYCLNIGYQAGQDQDGDFNVFFGQNAGKDNVADGCMGIGAGACQDNTKDNLFEFVQNNVNAVPLLKGFFDTLDLIQGCPDGAAADDELGNNTAQLYLDEGADKLKVKVKYSDGTVKTGDVANLI